MDGRPVIVSACLVGVRSRYDGTDALCKELLESLKGTPVVPVCPEQLGGLPTPRPGAEIEGGEGGRVLVGKARVIDVNGIDRTGSFIKGAREVLKIARLAGAKRAILKEKSPSCGVKASSKEGTGTGVTAALLKSEGIEVTGVE